MFFKKVYGQSKTETCPFCGKTAVTSSAQGVPVCIAHKNEELYGFKCVCGENLDIRAGKWGPYFSCINCGNMNFKKAMEVNPDWNTGSRKRDEMPFHQNNALKSNSINKPVKKPENESFQPKKQFNEKPNYKAEKETKKEITIRSDELDFYFG